MRMTDATNKGSPNLSKRAQRLSRSSSEPNLLLVLAKRLATLRACFYSKNSDVLRRAIARKLFYISKSCFFMKSQFERTI